MPTVDEAIYSRLSTYAGLSFLVGTRITPHPVPENSIFPCVTYQEIDASRQYAFGGPVALAEALFQINVWAKRHQDARTVAEQIRLGLSGYRGSPGSLSVDFITIEDESSDYENDTQLFHIRQDYRFFYRESQS